MQRLRGLQMAMVYARCLSKALAEYRALVEQSNLDPATSRDWTLVPPSPENLPPIKSSALKPTFASSSFRCGLAWNPHHGKDLTALIDTSSAAKGGTQWKVVDPNKRISDSGKKCGYIDDKAELEGTVDDGWVYFVLKGVKAPSSSDHDAKGRGGGGMVGFCADFKKDARLTDYEVLVLLNGEEVQEDMEFWLDARTLGISIQCYGTNKMVRAGENNLGFRVMQRGITFKLTHVIWR